MVSLSLFAISFSLSLFEVDISFGERESNWSYFNLVFALDNNIFFLFKEKARGEVIIIIISYFKYDRITSLEFSTFQSFLVICTETTILESKI